MFLVKYISIIVVLWSFWAPVFGQVSTSSSSVSLTIPAIALLDIEPNVAPITLTFAAPTQAGLPLTVSSASSNSTKWLNYSSAINAGGTTRTISAQVTSGTIPAGVSLRVQAGTYTGTGAGTLGTPAGLVTLGPTAQTVVSGIGRCYTGNGGNRGHLLTYSMIISNYDLLNFSQSTNLQITYTISD